MARMPCHVLAVRLLVRLMVVLLWIAPVAQAWIVMTAQQPQQPLSCYCCSSSSMHLSILQCDLQLIQITSCSRQSSSSSRPGWYNHILRSTTAAAAGADDLTAAAAAAAAAAASNDSILSATNEALASSSTTTATTMICLADLMAMDVVVFSTTSSSSSSSNNNNPQPQPRQLGAVQDNGRVTQLCVWTLEPAFATSLEFLVDDHDYYLLPGYTTTLEDERIVIHSIVPQDKLSYGSRQVGGGMGPGNPHGEESELLYYIDQSIVDENGIQVVVKPELEIFW